MTKNIESIKHKDRRAHIPSREEAGYEDASPQVQSGKKVLDLPQNPVTHRGQDPELFWLHKYGKDDRDDLLRVDVRSLYRHEHIAPETLIKGLYRVTEVASDQGDLFSVNELFGNALEKDELEKVGDYYRHQDGWTNRLIQGDSQLVMASLLEREGMAGQVQCIYMDPPYGIKYGSNWQIRLNNRDVKDGSDDALAGEPEVIKAFRDTWELGIHSYLSYLRDRLLIARELLTESGSCFVQISDENVHLVRCVMDEVFGSENFVVTICFQKKAYQDAESLAPVNDYILWYSKNKNTLKYRKLFSELEFDGDVGKYNKIVSPSGEIESSLTLQSNEIKHRISTGWRLMRDDYPIVSQDPPKEPQPFEYEGIIYEPPKGRHWSVKYPDGLQRLAEKGRLRGTGKRLYAVDYWTDRPLVPQSNFWVKMKGAADPLYVVQTTSEAVQRCLLMTTDPGDLVLDPTCGSGTTAYVAEQWGRRWITIDTSRIALNIAKERLMTATYTYYKLYDENCSDIRQGFIYSTVQNITLKSLAYDEPPDMETLYDQPKTDKKRLRVSGPFTVETLQNFEPVNPESLDDEVHIDEEDGAFEETIRQHLLSTGIKNGRKNEQVLFTRVELLSHSYLHSEGFYLGGMGERKAYFHIGPKFGTVSKAAVNEAVKECRTRGDADWLVILGFSFESDIEGGSKTMSLGAFEVTKARIHDDLLQEGLKKKPAKSAASFVTIGEPDITLHRKGPEATVEICGLDIYDPIRDEVKARNVNEIAYWMVDDDYDGSNFVVRQVFFCGGDKDEFNKWKKGLDMIAKEKTRKKAEKTLKIEINEDAFDRLYGHISHPIAIKRKDQKIAVRIISQFGEECTKVIGV